MKYMPFSARFLMRHLFALLLAAFVLTGCNNAPPSADAPAGSASVGGVGLGIPMPSAEILSALGPENDISFRHLLPDPIFVIVGKPKQFLASPVGRGNEPLVSSVMMQWLQLDRLNPGNIERFVQTNGVPMPVLINPNPQEPTQQQIFQIMRRATMLTFDAPVDRSAFVTSVWNIDPAFFETLKRTEGKIEYYDLTPPGLIVPQRLAFAFLDDRTLVFAEGLENDIKAIFSETIPKNAVLDRLKHTPINTSDLTILTSLEGLNMSPQMLEQLMGQASDAGVIPHTLALAISQHLRAVTLSLNVSESVVEGQPVVSLDAEGRDEKSAEALDAVIRGLIALGQTTLITMNDDAKRMFPIPPDFALSLLNAMSVKVQGTRVSAVLNNFETLIPTIATEIHHRQTVIQQQELQQRQVEQLMVLTELWMAYYAEHKKIPADILDAEGKPLLSWRVALLPLMGLEDLYNKFKLDEPWDSEANKELLGTMPFFFVPLGSEAAPPKTVVRFFDSAGTPLANRDLKIEDLPSLQTTMLFVSVAPQYAVEWTKPDSLAFDIGTLADIVGSPLVGITFTKQLCVVPILPETEPQYEKWKQDVEALVKGTPLPTPEQ